jgi:tetratricopeptide (TPR) repeat protein
MKHSANSRPKGSYLNQADALQLATEHQIAGRLREAEAIVREIVKVVPKHAGALHLLGIIAHQSGQTGVGIQMIKEAIDARNDIGLFHSNLAEMQRLAGASEEGIASARRGAELDPRSASAHSNLGIALYHDHQLDEAEACQQRALELAPDSALALNSLGSIYRRREDSDKAIEYYRAALSADPQHLEAMNNLGAILTESELAQEAKDVLVRAVRLNPRYAEAHRNLGTVFLQEEDFFRAAVAYEEALKHRPGFTEALVGLAIVKRETNELDRAQSLLEQVLAADAQNGPALNQLATLSADAGYPEQALEFIERAIDAEQESESCLVTKGHLLTQFGDLEGAQVALEQALIRKPDSVPAKLAMVQLKKVKPHDTEIPDLEAKLATLQSTSIARRTSINFGLGKCYDDIGDHLQAMDYFLEGCRLKRQRVEHNADEHDAHIAHIMEVFNSAFIDRFACCGDASNVPIFVLGMPRSGTTLTEQIIASHSQAHGAGELPDLLGLANRSILTGAQAPFPESITTITARELETLGAKYVVGLRERHASAERITDKMPANFLALGLIHLMLPNARIVHVRRNAVDTCVSNITKLFKNGQSHSYNLVELGRFYLAYDRLMAHWRAVLPAGAFYEVQYEALVADTETQARSLVEACGLPWEEQCLDFHKTERAIRTASVTQVRQPIYATSVARWRRYESRIGPLIETLGELAESVI